MSSTGETALLALHAALALVPAVPGFEDLMVARNPGTAFELPDVGGWAAVLYDGDPGDPIDETIGVRTKTYSHEAEVELVVSRADDGARDADFDALRVQIATTLRGNLALQAAVEALDVEEPDAVDTTPVEGAAAEKRGRIRVRMEYTVTQ